MIGKTRYYLCDLGNPVLVLNKSFASMNLAREYKKVHKIQDYVPIKGSVILDWANRRNYVIQIVPVENIVSERSEQ